MGACLELLVGADVAAGKGSRGESQPPSALPRGGHGHARASGRCSAREMSSAVVTVLDTSVSGGRTEPKPRTGEEKNDMGRVSELSQYEFHKAILIYTMRGSNALRDHQMKSAI